MRCVGLTGTWNGLRDWCDAHDVLVLPRLTGDGQTARQVRGAPSLVPAAAG